MHSLLLVTTVALLACPPLLAVPVQTATDGTWQDEVRAIEADALARIRVSNAGLDLPLDPPVDPQRLHTLAHADRLIVPDPDAYAAASDGSGPTLVNKWLNPTLTGTGFGEWIQYQLPTNYAPGGPPHPLVLAYHGYGGSHQSVALQSTIHLECESRGWIYVAPVGLDTHFFGPPATVTHVETALDWMTANLNIDAERMYMVGFSMGGGVSASFVGRHRDPNGYMFAALGIVSSTLDWTQEHFLDTTPSLSVQAIMEHPLCFEGPPSAFPFNYRRASDLFFDTGSYPPLPGTPLPDQTMATNLGSTPTYLTWDSGDTLAQVPLVCAELANVLTANGTEQQVVITSGTPTPHSWGVLDEEDLFDFFEGREVDRYPSAFQAQVQESADVSWASIQQRNAGAFSYVSGSTDENADSINVTEVVNVSHLTVDADTAGIPRGGPVRVLASSADADGFTLELRGFDTPPSYLLDAVSGQLIAGLSSDPFTGSVSIDVPAFGQLEFDVISEPWLGSLSTAPQPAPNGGNVTLSIDSDPGDVWSWMIIAFDEQLVPIKQGNVITASPFSPSLLLVLPLDGQGDVTVPSSIPFNPVFVGLEILMQSVTITAAAKVGTVSNMWRMTIE